MKNEGSNNIFGSPDGNRRLDQSSLSKPLTLPEDDLRIAVFLMRALIKEHGKKR